MRTEINRIIDLLEQAHFGKCWAGDNFQTILSQVNPTSVNMEIKGFNNTIHQIVRHIIGTDNLIIQRINGNNNELSQEENWPSSKKLEAIEWSKTLNLKDETMQNLIQHISLLNDDQLELSPFTGFSPWYVQLHGLIEHLHYHMAQIRLLDVYLKTGND